MPARPWRGSAPSPPLATAVSSSPSCGAWRFWSRSIVAVLAAGTVGFILTEDVSAWRRLRLDPGHDRDDRLDPGPGQHRRPDRQGPPDRARRGYALLRLGDDDRVLRRRSSGRDPRGAPNPEEDRRPLRPPPDLRLRPGRAGRSPATCRPAATPSSSSTTVREQGDRGPDRRSVPPRPALGRRDAAGGRDRPRAISVLACVDSDAENIFICLTAQGAALGHHDRRPGERRGLREEAAAGRRRPGDLAVQVERRRDGAAGAPPAGRRRRRRRTRVPDGGDRGHRGLRGRGQGDRRHPRHHRDRRPPRAPTARSSRSRRPSTVLRAGRRAGGDGNRRGAAAPRGPLFTPRRARSRRARP